MTEPIQRRLGSFATWAVCWVLAIPVGAQGSRINEVTATVPSVGEVLALSPLSAGDRDQGGDLQVHGTVTTRHNGPYRLQVRHRTPFTDNSGRGGTQPVNQLQARQPNGSFATLGTVDWVTIATGPGAESSLNQVEFLIVWAQTSSKNPSLAVTIPVEYRVVPP